MKFKTAEEEYFEKEYLKDVKLDMLEKFGRQVRYSIVDEDDEEDDQGDRSHYESMQLIEEVAEEGKSFIEKEELVEEE